MNKNYIVGIGTVLAVLLIFAVPVMAGPNTVYFVPSSSSAGPDEITYVEAWLNMTDSYGTCGDNYALSSVWINVTFNPSIGDIIDCNRVPNDPWDLTWGKMHLGDSWWINAESEPWDDLGTPEDPYGLDPGVYPIANFTIRGMSSGTMDVHFSRDNPRISNMLDAIGCDYPDQVWNDGTFTCVGLPTTFTKSLSTGWNLISLPLTPTDNSTSAVLSGVSDVVYRYNATSKQFECPSTMDPGIGYFVDVTSASTWEYEGIPVSSTSPGLKSGLNMIGVPNCTMSVSDAMGSADYRYVARWNAADQKFEVYNPSAPPAFHHFDTIEAGEGYFVSAKSDDDTFTISCP